MKHALALGAILGVFVFLVRREVFPWPYYYDEADYMFAASLGVHANWIDSPSQSLADFVRAGISEGADPANRAQLSAASRAGSDVNFYRHWHGPLYFYWLSAIALCHLDEHATRALSYVFPILTALVLYFGSLWIFAEPAAAILSAALFLWSYATVSSNEVAPHQLFVLCSMVALILLMKWRATGQARFWYGSAIAAACAFCTLEVAFVLVAVLIFCAGRVPSIAKSALVFLLAVVLLWPASLAKLTFLKAYLFMAYLAVFRPSAWGNAGLLETWRLRLTQSPVEWLLLAIAAALYFRFLDPARRKQLLPVALYGCCMLLALLRVNSETPRYMLPFLPPFDFAAGCTLALTIRNWKPMLRFSAALAILLAVFAGTFITLHAHPVRPSPRLAEILTAVRSANLVGKQLLAPRNDVPMIHYYFPRIATRGYLDLQERAAILAQHDCDAVLDPGYPVALRRRSRDSPHYLSQP